MERLETLRLSSETPSGATRPPGFYWLSAVVLLLWALGGASIYVAYFVQTPGEFASTAEDLEHRDAYAEYVANIPMWAIGAGIAAAAARLLGALGLFLRRNWAYPFYGASLLFFLVALYRAFVLARVASVMSTSHIVTEVVFLVLSLYAIWLCRWSRSHGILR